MARRLDEEDDLETSPEAPIWDPNARGDSRPRTKTMMVETRTTLRVRRVKLAVIAGPDEGASTSSERDSIRIGAHPVCDLVLSDRTASRQHCEIQYTEQGYLLIDLESTNGTLLDGKRVERAYLSPGSKIKIGQTIMTFNATDEEISVEADRDGELGRMIGKSVRMRQIFGLIKKVAPMDVTVMITGETGTGKELAARAIHDLSARRDGPFVVLDCGAIPEGLIESELFGHEKGAFTGADRTRPGAFERANGGTIFLDELGELDLELQPRLLRVLENREVRRVGSNKIQDVDVRVIAATNRNLEHEIAQGHFREDLFFRLSVIQLTLPPLRERRDDIAPIVRRLLREPERVAQHGEKRVSDGAMRALQDYDWPGNIRELVNAVERVLALGEGDDIEVGELPPEVQGLATSASPGGASLAFNDALPFKEAKEQIVEAFERAYLAALLERCEGNYSEAARQSGLHRKSVERLAKKYGL